MHNGADPRWALSNTVSAGASALLRPSGGMNAPDPSDDRAALLTFGVGSTAFHRKEH